MSQRLKIAIAILVVAALVCQPVAYALPIVSNTATGQTAAERAAELNSARVRLGTDSIPAALVRAGLSPEEAAARMAALSTQDLIRLAAAPAQVQSAGITMTRRAWVYTGIALGAIAAGAYAISAKDDGEDTDDSDDGED